MKTAKKKTVRQGTRRMINAQAVTPYGLLTYRGGETAFFLLRPTCISVLPEDALAARVGALVTVFKSQPELEILCLNSRESFANNTRYLEARIEEEENPYIADLLEKDKAHLGSVQLQTATAREFVLAVRLEAVREKEKYPYLARMEKLIRDQGFDVRRADLDDVKRLMAVYFVQDFTSEHYDDFDGQRWVEWTGVQADRKAPDSASQPRRPCCGLKRTGSSAEIHTGAYGRCGDIRLRPRNRPFYTGWVKRRAYPCTSIRAALRRRRRKRYCRMRIRRTV